MSFFKAALLVLAALGSAATYQSYSSFERSAETVAWNGPAAGMAIAVARPDEVRQERMAA